MESAPAGPAGFTAAAFAGDSPVVCWTAVIGKSPALGVGDGVTSGAAAGVGDGDGVGGANKSGVGGMEKIANGVPDDENDVAGAPVD